MGILRPAGFGFIRHDSRTRLAYKIRNPNPRYIGCDEKTVKHLFHGLEMVEAEGFEPTTH
jgi:hypothetical protein